MPTLVERVSKLVALAAKDVGASPPSTKMVRDACAKAVRKMARLEPGFAGHVDFLRRMAEDPHDTATPQVYADWLDEHEMPHLAEVIRRHVADGHSRKRFLPSAEDMAPGHDQPDPQWAYSWIHEDSPATLGWGGHLRQEGKGNLVVALNPRQHGLPVMAWYSGLLDDNDFVRLHDGLKSEGIGEFPGSNYLGAQVGAARERVKAAQKVKPATAPGRRRQFRDEGPPRQMARPSSPLYHKLLSIRPELAKAAQSVYDQWDQSGEDGDPELGFGGICQDIADAFSGVLGHHGIEHTILDAQIGDQHVWTAAYDDHHLFHVDIHPSHYETGGGYNWQKIHDVQFSPEHVDVIPGEREDVIGEDGEPHHYRRRRRFTRVESSEPIQRLPVKDMARFAALASPNGVPAPRLHMTVPKDREPGQPNLGRFVYFTHQGHILTIARIGSVEDQGHQWRVGYDLAHSDQHSPVLEAAYHAGYTSDTANSSPAAEEAFFQAMGQADRENKRPYGHSASVRHPANAPQHALWQENFGKDLDSAIASELDKLLPGVHARLEGAGSLEGLSHNTTIRSRLARLATDAWLTYLKANPNASVGEFPNTVGKIVKMHGPVSPSAYLAGLVADRAIRKTSLADFQPQQLLAALNNPQAAQLLRRGIRDAFKGWSQSVTAAGGEADARAFLDAIRRQVERRLLDGPVGPDYKAQVKAAGDLGDKVAQQLAPAIGVAPEAVVDDPWRFDREQLLFPAKLRESARMGLARKMLGVSTG